MLPCRPFFAVYDPVHNSCDIKMQSTKTDTISFVLWSSILCFPISGRRKFVGKVSHAMHKMFTDDRNAFYSELISLFILSFLCVDEDFHFRCRKILPTSERCQINFGSFMKANDLLSIPINVFEFSTIFADLWPLLLKVLKIV